MYRVWRKLLELCLLIWALGTAVFFVLYVLPGDPARIILGPQASGQSVAEFRNAAGLNSGLLHRYIAFVHRTAHLDFGYSWAQRRSVAGLLWERGKATV